MVRLLALLAVIAAADCPGPGPGPVPPGPPDVNDASPAPTPTPPPTPPPPVPLPDASDPASRACDILRQRGCGLGKSPSCMTTMNLPSRFGVTSACVIAAGLKGPLVSCNISCTP